MFGARGEQQPRDNGGPHQVVLLVSLWPRSALTRPTCETSAANCCLKKLEGGVGWDFENVAASGDGWWVGVTAGGRKRDPGVIRFATSRNTVSHCVSLHPCPPPGPGTVEDPTQHPLLLFLNPPPPLKLSLQAIATGVESIPEHNAYALNGCFSMPPVRCHQQMGS